MFAAQRHIVRAHHQHQQHHNQHQHQHQLCRSQQLGANHLAVPRTSSGYPKKRTESKSTSNLSHHRIEASPDRKEINILGLGQTKIKQSSKQVESDTRQREDRSQLSSEFSHVQPRREIYSNTIGAQLFQNKLVHAKLNRQYSISTSGRSKSLNSIDVDQGESSCSFSQESLPFESENIRANEGEKNCQSRALVDTLRDHKFRKEVGEECSNGSTNELPQTSDIRTDSSRQVRGGVIWSSMRNLWYLSHFWIDFLAYQLETWRILTNRCTHSSRVSSVHIEDELSVIRSPSLRAPNAALKIRSPNHKLVDRECQTDVKHLMSTGDRKDCPGKICVSADKDSLSSSCETPIAPRDTHLPYGELQRCLQIDSSATEDSNHLLTDHSYPYRAGISAHTMAAYTPSVRQQQMSPRKLPVAGRHLYAPVTDRFRYPAMSFDLSDNRNVQPQNRSRTADGAFASTSEHCCLPGHSLVKSRPQGPVYFTSANSNSAFVCPSSKGSKLATTISLIERNSCSDSFDFSLEECHSLPLYTADEVVKSRPGNLSKTTNVSSNLQANRLYRDQSFASRSLAQSVGQFRDGKHLVEAQGRTTYSQESKVVAGSESQFCYAPNNSSTFRREVQHLNSNHLEQRSNLSSHGSLDRSSDRHSNGVSDCLASGTGNHSSRAHHSSSKGGMASKLSLAGARKRLGFKRNGLNALSVQRSEEVIPSRESIDRLTHQSMLSSLSESNYDRSHSRWLNQTHWLPLSQDDPSSYFIEGLGPGQIASRQALVSPYLGDIQLTLSDKRGMLEVEVVRARRLQPKISANALPYPYVKIYLMKDKKCIAKCKTTQSKQTLDPFYQQLFIFREDYAECILQIIVWGDYGKKDKKSLMGLAQIQMNDLDISELVIGWYKLFNAPSMASSLHSSKALRQMMISKKVIGNNSC